MMYQSILENDPALTEQSHINNHKIIYMCTYIVHITHSNMWAFKLNSKSSDQTILWVTLKLSLNVKIMQYNSKRAHGFI